MDFKPIPEFVIVFPTSHSDRGVTNKPDSKSISKINKTFLQRFVYRKDFTRVYLHPPSAGISNYGTMKKRTFPQLAQVWFHLKFLQAMTEIITRKAEYL
jgi:hypothetical protein